MNDDYEKWYVEAIEASNELGFAGMSAAAVIRYQAEELKQLREQPSALLAESAARQLIESGAVNFVGSVFTITADAGGEQFEVVVTTQLMRCQVTA